MKGEFIATMRVPIMINIDEQTQKEVEEALALELRFKGFPGATLSTLLIAPPSKG